jgi:drug/metabolite transporter (DMT)-like permease
VSSPALYRLSILGAAALFSTGGAAIKACGMSGWQVACLRSGVAGLMVALLVPASRRGWSWRTQLVGLGYAVTLTLFVLGNKLTTAANTIFLQATAPLYILLLSPLLLKEHVTRRDLLLMLAIGVGLGLVFVDLEPAASAPDPFTGNILGAFAGLTWAFTLMGLRWLERHSVEGTAPGLASVVSGNALAFLFALPFAWPIEATAPVDWAIIGYLGIVQIGLAYLLLTRGFRHVPAFEASLLILLEPTLNPLWAWLVQREVPSGWALAGGATILAATASKTWIDRVEHRESLTKR